ncbi:MAG: CoA transferase [Negativicutes bacterium]|nr:CoA transferase [Negativicutes bacterium]
MERMGALDGLRVLDLTRVLAGPFAGMMMADLGANVIKVEEPERGADERHMGPFLNGESAYFMNLNRNKRGITVNLKSPKGKEVFKDLVKNADIVLENFRPGTMEKLGLGYEELKKVNPAIIYGAISGFGHYGPYKDRPGYDIISQAMSGLMSTTGWPGGEPTRTGTAMGDVLGGLSVVIGILSAVYNRQATGLGQKVDVALVDSAVASLEIINMIYLVEKRIPQRIGNRYESTYPYDSFKAADGSIVIGTANDKLWQALCKVMNRPDLAAKEEWARVRDRVQNNAAVKIEVENWTQQHKAADLVDMLLAGGVPAAPINNIEQVVNDPHIAGAREMFVEIEHPKAGKLKITGSHIKLSDTPPVIRIPSPGHGQHNAEVLNELLGMTADEVAKLKTDGAI